jgi:imidazole glycerol phosphate synthase glutamine amidotransferase subunit
MASLNASGYADALRGWIRADKPFLGICIGLQLLYGESEEAPPVDGAEVRGLGVLAGKVKRFPGRKVPQIGWNRTEARAPSKLFAGIPAGSFFYYIHSYYCESADDADVAAETDYYSATARPRTRGPGRRPVPPEKSGPWASASENWAGKK